MALRSSPSLLLASLAVLGACARATPPPDAPPPTSSAPPVAKTETPSVPIPNVVDLCVQLALEDRVCVLFEDGRVSCANVDEAQFAPPVDGITNAIEISCGKHSICILDGEGSVFCLDDWGHLKHFETLAFSRSLARDCAVTYKGELACWTRWGELYVRPGIEGKRDVIVHRIARPDHGEHGCALEQNGDLWCWGDGRHGVGSWHETKPRVIANLGRVAHIRELALAGDHVCWRGPGEWLCTDGNTPPEPGFYCDHRRCTCILDSEGCRTLKPNQPVDSSRVLRDVVQNDEMCMYDDLDRVWCANVHEPPHQIAISTSAPKPEPDSVDMPDPTLVHNRVCDHLAEPGGPLACTPSKTWGSSPDLCERRCDLSTANDDALDPAGFVFVRANNEIYYVVYVDGPSVWVGPPVPETNDDPSPPVADGDEPVTIDLEIDREDGSSHHDIYKYESELSSLMVCALVDGRPACSLPIAREWFYSHEYWEEDTGRQTRDETIEYEAELEVTKSGVKVEVLEGKRHVNSKNPYLDGARVLRSGTHSLESLLDQPFVLLIE